MPCIKFELLFLKHFERPPSGKTTTLLIFCPFPPLLVLALTNVIFERSTVRPLDDNSLVPLCIGIFSKTNNKNIQEKLQENYSSSYDVVILIEITHNDNFF